MTIYLYIKQHSITKMKYFGRTIKSDPYKYQGSGKYWLNHINKYGKQHVITLEVFEFNNQEEATAFALMFSEYNCIVESKLWANLQPENALHVGRPKGIKCSDEAKRKMSIAKIGYTPWNKGKKVGYRKRKPFSKEWCKNIGLGQTDFKIYKFYHPIYGIEICNRQELIQKYSNQNINNSSLSKLFSRKVKTYRGWSLYT